MRMMHFTLLVDTLMCDSGKLKDGGWQTRSADRTGVKMSKAKPQCLLHPTSILSDITKTIRTRLL